MAKPRVARVPEIWRCGSAPDDLIKIKCPGDYGSIDVKIDNDKLEKFVNENVYDALKELMADCLYLYRLKPSGKMQAIIADMRSFSISTVIHDTHVDEVPRRVALMSNQISVKNRKEAPDPDAPAVIAKEQARADKARKFDVKLDECGDPLPGMSSDDYHRRLSMRGMGFDRKLACLLELYNSGRLWRATIAFEDVTGHKDELVVSVACRDIP